MSTPNHYRKSTDRVPLRDEERTDRPEPSGCATAVTAVIVTTLAIVWNLFKP